MRLSTLKLRYVCSRAYDAQLRRSIDGHDSMTQPSTQHTMHHSQCLYALCAHRTAQYVVNMAFRGRQHVVVLAQRSIWALGQTHTCVCTYECTHVFHKHRTMTPTQFPITHTKRICVLSTLHTHACTFESIAHRSRYHDDRHLAQEPAPAHAHHVT